jgi:hypothetical protein
MIMVDVVLALGEQLEEDLARLGIEVGGRLVHHQHLRLAAERDGDEDLLLLAAGELDEGLAADALDVEAEAQRQRGDALRVGAAQRGGEADQLADRHLQRRRQLRHEADLRQHLGAVRARRPPVDGDLAFMGVLAEQAADQRGLAGAVGADQGDALAQPDVRG